MLPVILAIVYFCNVLVPQDPAVALALLLACVSLMARCCLRAVWAQEEDAAMVYTNNNTMMSVKLTLNFRGFAAVAESLLLLL